MIRELTSAIKWDPVFCFYISSLWFPESAGILHPFSQKNQWYVSRDRLAVKATAWTSDPVTEHISHFRMFVNDILICSWALCHVLGLCVAGLFPLTPAGVFQTGEQMLLIVFTMTWLTSMWQRVKQGSLMSEKLRAEKKFSASKYKERNYINIKLWVEYRA